MVVVIYARGPPATGGQVSPYRLGDHEVVTPHRPQLGPFAGAKD